MHKIKLTEQAIYHGDVKMPEGWHINSEELTADILESKLKNKPQKFSKNWDRLNTYIIEHTMLRHSFPICKKETWGNVYEQNENTPPILEVNLMDLNSSPDYVCLYGVNVEDCIVNIAYDDNRFKNKVWTIPLKNNKFVMFPATNLYNIENNQKNNKLNFVQVITYIVT